MTFEGLLSQVLNGLTIGGILMLIAIGLTLIFGLMGVVNFAHGALYMLGAYLAFEVVSVTGHWWLALIVAPIGVGLLGLVLERTLIRSIYGGDPIRHVLLTFGVAIVLSEAVEIIWGSRIQVLLPPDFLSRSVSFLGITYPTYRLVVLLVSCLVAGSVWFVLRQTNIGLMIRSATHDREMVEALGIDIKRVFTGVFVAGTALAGLAGVLIAPLWSVHPEMGTNVIVVAFIAVIVGGLGNVGGAMAGAMLVGVVEVLGALFIPGMARASIYALVVVVLIVKSAGLFGGQQSA